MKNKNRFQRVPFEGEWEKVGLGKMKEKERERNKDRPLVGPCALVFTVRPFKSSLRLEVWVWYVRLNSHGHSSGFPLIRVKYIRRVLWCWIIWPNQNVEIFERFVGIIKPNLNELNTQILNCWNSVSTILFLLFKASFYRHFYLKHLFKISNIN